MMAALLVIPTLITNQMKSSTMIETSDFGIPRKRLWEIHRRRKPAFVIHDNEASLCEKYMRNEAKESLTLLGKCGLGRWRNNIWQMRFH